MKALLLTTITIFFGLPVLSGQVSLRNSLSGKTITLKAEGQVGVGIPIAGPDLDCGYRLLNGRLRDTNRGLIRVLPEEEEKTLTFSNGLSRKEDILYKNIKNVPPISLPLADIGHLTYRRKGAEGRNNWGVLLASLGAFSALVAAPLASINYSEGGFNSGRYFRWAGYSLGAAGAGAALALSGKKRHFKIQGPGQAAGSELWVIEK